MIPKDAATPVARQGAAITHYSTFVLVHGGSSDASGDSVLSDAWAFDTTSQRWLVVERNLLARVNHRIVELKASEHHSSAEADELDGGFAVMGGGKPSGIIASRDASAMFGQLLQQHASVVRVHEGKSSTLPKKAGLLHRMSEMVISLSLLRSCAHMSDARFAQYDEKVNLKVASSAKEGGSRNDPEQRKYKVSAVLFLVFFSYASHNNNF